MPQPGETITEGTIVKWIVKQGDSIKEGQNIVELETEKAVFEYESPYEGKLIEISGKPNQKVPVGETIAVFEVSDEKAKAYALLGLGQKNSSKKSGGAASGARTLGRVGASLAAPSKSMPLSPMVRALLREHNLSEDVAQNIPASGPGGRLTKEDILKYISVGAGFKPAPTWVPEEVDLQPASPIRMRIAENMVASKQSIPHAHTGLTVDMTLLVDYRNKNKTRFEKKHAVTLSVLPLMMPALISAIKEVPLVNSFFHENASGKYIGYFKKINLGIATGTEKGLFTPVLHDVGSLSMVDFAKKLKTLMEHAMNYKLTPKDLTGMTFTFNNYGFFGSTTGVQIVPPGHSSILGMGKIEKRPWVIGDKIEVRHLADFVLAFDHRVLDGRDVGLFLNAFKKALENPDFKKWEF
ncbi:MAG: hypothetical protein A2048_03830 [Deltaproteobacteria bacterium GWA2_45_12]|nr:MAG: hypothetical protein A2048_03830 [Deltaproteobacteria bacterium GWA2_45_12]